MTPEKIAERLRLRKELMDSTKGTPIPVQVCASPYAIRPKALSLMGLEVLPSIQTDSFLTLLFHHGNRRRKRQPKRQHRRRPHRRTIVLRLANPLSRVPEKLWTTCTKLVMNPPRLDEQQLCHSLLHVHLITNLAFNISAFSFYDTGAALSPAEINLVMRMRRLQKQVCILRLF